jgi:hypothetical protein
VYFIVIYLISFHSKNNPNQLPSDMNLVSCIWFYRIKRERNRQVNMYKEIMVSKVFQQIHRIDYDETFALVENMESILISLSIVETNG